MKNLFIALLLIFEGPYVLGQISKLYSNTPKGFYAIKGDYYLNHQNYALAISQYKNSLSKNPHDVYAMLQMADAYAQSGDSEQAIQLYDNALGINPFVDGKYILKYLALLLENNKNEELSRWLKNYQNAISKRILSPNEYWADTSLVMIKNISVNSGTSEISPVLYKNKLFFSSDRANGYKLYSSIVSPGKNYEEPKLLREGINSEMSEGALAIAQQQGSLFFTRTAPLKSQQKTPAQVLFCDANESNPVKPNKLKLSFKSGMESPAVSSDGSTIFFISNNQKGNSGYDLYQSKYNGKKWSEPQLLSSAINTRGDEMYPTLQSDTILYFSSNGHRTLGGFDIYKVNLTKPNAPIEHLPAPFNSPNNDFSLNFTDDHNGYFSSDRPGGHGSDDLYGFHTLSVKILKQRGDGEPDSKFKPGDLSVYTSQGEEYIISNGSQGNLNFEFAPGTNYSLTMEYDNQNKGTFKPSNNKMNLLAHNNYNFHVQKMIQTAAGINYFDVTLKDLHVNPGDLITFLLIPKSPTKSAPTNSKIHFQNNEVTIKNLDTLVFSYVAEGTPLPDENIAQPIADLNSKKIISTTKAIDTISTVKNSKTILPKDTTTAKVTNEKITAAVLHPADKLENQFSSPTDTSSIKTPVTVATDSVAIVPVNAITQQNNSPEQKQSDKNIRTETKLEEGNTTVAQSDKTKQLSLKTDSSNIKKYSASDSLTRMTSLSKEDQLKSANKDITNKALKPSMVKNDLKIPNSKTDTTIAKNASKSDSSITTQAKESLTKNILKDDQKKPIALSNNQLTDKNVSIDAKKDKETNPTGSIDKNNTSEFHYRVQIAAARSELSSTELKKIYSSPHEVRSFNEDGYHKYYIKETSSFPIAHQALKESGVNNAFIVVYKGDRKLNLYEAIIMQKKGDTDKLKDGAKGLRDTASMIPAISESTKNNESEKKIQDRILIPVSSNQATEQNTISNDNPNVSNAKQLTDTAQLSTTSLGQSIRSENNPVKYRVQIAASAAEMSYSEIKKRYSGPLQIHSVKEGGLVKYYIGETSNYYEAKKVLNESHVEHSFVTAYVGNIKSRLEDVIAAQYKKPLVRSELAKSDSVIKVVTVNFEFDEFTLTPSEKAHLQKDVIEQLKAQAQYRAIVNGYTDARGTEEYNFGLSQERAYFVEQLIIDEGISKSRVSAQYFGESQAIKYCPTEENCDESVHQANRRVEVLFLVNKK